MTAPSGDLTLLSLSIKLFEFEFSLSSQSLSLTHTTHTHSLTQIHTTGDRTERSKCAYLPSWSICSPHVAEGQQRQEKCEFGAATVKLVH